MRRLRSAAVVLAVVAVAAGAWTLSVRGVRRADAPSVAEHRTELVTQARLAARPITAWFVQSRAELHRARDTLGVWSGARGQIAAASGALDATGQGLGNLDGGLIVVDRDSIVVATSGPLAGLLRQERASAAITAALNGNEAAGDVARDPLTRQRAVSLAAPLRDGRGGVTGAIVGFSRVPEGSLSALVATTRDAFGRPFAVVSPGGTLVAPAGDTNPDIARVDDGLAAAVKAAGGAGHLTYPGEGGESTVAAYTPVADGYVLVAARPAAALAVTGERATAAAATAMAVLLAVAAAVILALLAVLRMRTVHLEEAKQSFLAIAGHELRTPLTVMKGFTDLLVERWEDVPDDSRRGIIETLNYQVRNLEHLVERLLFGAQLEAGISPSTSQEAVELKPLVEEVAAHHRGIAPLHAVVVDVPDGLTIKGDATALEHVVTNLVENAVKYSPDGGTVTVSARTPRGAVQLCVEDEGIGLPKDLDGIFDKFVQREAVDTRVHDEGGVGLGLYITRTLVEQMGGSVRAARRAPKGATFTVTLKRAS